MEKQQLITTLLELHREFKKEKDAEILMATVLGASELDLFMEWLKANQDRLGKEEEKKCTCAETYSDYDVKGHMKDCDFAEQVNTTDQEKFLNLKALIATAEQTAYDLGFEDGKIQGKKEAYEEMESTLAEDTKKFLQGFAYKPPKE